MILNILTLVGIISCNIRKFDICKRTISHFSFFPLLSLIFISYGRLLIYFLINHSPLPKFLLHCIHAVGRERNIELYVDTMRKIHRYKWQKKFFQRPGNISSKGERVLCMYVYKKIATDIYICLRFKAFQSPS